MDEMFTLCQILWHGNTFRRPNVVVSFGLNTTFDCVDWHSRRQCVSFCLVNTLLKPSILWPCWATLMACWWCVSLLRNAKCCFMTGLHQHLEELYRTRWLSVLTTSFVLAISPVLMCWYVTTSRHWFRCSTGFCRFVSLLLWSRYQSGNR